MGEMKLETSTMYFFQLIKCYTFTSVVHSVYFISNVNIVLLTVDEDKGTCRLSGLWNSGLVAVLYES